MKTRRGNVGVINASKDADAAERGDQHHVLDGGCRPGRTLATAEQKGEDAEIGEDIRQGGRAQEVSLLCRFKRQFVVLQCDR